MMRKKDFTGLGRKLIVNTLQMLAFALVVVLLMVMLLKGCAAEAEAAEAHYQEVVKAMPEGITIPAVEVVHDYEPEQIVYQQVKTEPIPEVQMEPEVVDTIETYDVPLDENLQLYIVQLCEEHHIEPTIILAMISRESCFRADAVGDGGNSLGLMQIQSRWHSARMDKLGVTDLLDPYQNVAVGIDYLAELIDEGKGSEWALMAYNGGPSYANELVAQGIISNYAKEILANSENLKGGV